MLSSILLPPLLLSGHKKPHVAMSPNLRDAEICSEVIHLVTITKILNLGKNHIFNQPFLTLNQCHHISKVKYQHCVQIWKN